MTGYDHTSNSGIAKLRPLITLKDKDLNKIDKGGKEGEHTNDFVKWVFTSHDFFTYIREAIESGAEKTKQIALDSINSTIVFISHYITTHQHTKTTETDKDTKILNPSVSDLEEDKRENHTDGCTPTIDQFSR
ncbi:hypothetical protein A0J61_06217 [Choanephora cucurbitarum]|uniref:Uncharacterized protein n=1 Tax=Choanephora cucurbitarum TaxID=101091 RepID=A0A1C7N9E2_9FUNG|nr:hypothetical protein A0J61_06217 [Choanephora cucurbitarum]